MILNSEETMDEWSKELFQKLWPTIVFLSSQIVVGVPGNLLVFCVYLKRFRPSAARVFILAMAVCDFLTNVISMPLMIFHLKHLYNSVDSPTCKFIQASWRFPTITSVLLLVCVAIDRHRCICFPFKQQITHRQAMLILPFLLIITVLLTLPFVVFFGKIRWKESSTICFMEEQYIKTPWRKRPTILLMVCFAIALVILMICYIHIVCKVRQLKMNRQRIGVYQPNQDDQGQQSKFSSNHNEPQQAQPSQKNIPPSAQTKEDSSSLSSPKMSSEDAIVPDNTNLIMTNITSPQQRDDLKIGNLATFKVTQEEIKTEGKGTMALNEENQKKTRSSKTTLMMLVLTLTTIVLFVPHLIIELCIGECHGVDSTLMEMNICQVAHLFPYLNSVINPFIYSFCNPKFHLQCRLFLRGVYNNVFLPIRHAFIRDSASR